MSNQCFDVAVVGLGAMGSAAAYQLSLLGKSVIGFEQFAPLHTFGSFHGDTRITRQALGEGEYYVPLVLRSNQIWRQIEERTGKELFTECGALITAFGERATREVDFFQTTLSAAVKHNISHELLDSSQLRRRFPQFLYRDDEVGYYESGGGFLRPERCIAVQQSLAAEAGATLMFETPVIDVQQLRTGGARICTKTGVFEVSQVILSTGSWIHRFVPDNLGKLFSIHRQVLYWFEPQNGVVGYSAKQCPVYIRIGSTQAEEIYGFPSIDGTGGGLKMATENFSASDSVEKINREVSEEEKEQAYGVLSRYLPLSPNCIKAVSCVYPTTPDHDFVIDFLPDFQECLILSPCSGHGFKHSAAVGEIAAQLLVDGRSEMDLSPFKLGRF